MRTDHLAAAGKHRQPFPPAMSDQCVDHTTTHFSTVHFELEKHALHVFHTNVSLKQATCLKQLMSCPSHGGEG